MVSQMYNTVFRQKVAAFDKDEVDIACDILVAMHPAAYFNALSRHYKSILSLNEEVGSIYMENYHEYQRLIGNEPYIDNQLVSDISEDTNDGTSDIMTTDNDLGSAVTDDDLNITSGKDIELPSFLVNNY